MKMAHRAWRMAHRPVGVGYGYITKQEVHFMKATKQRDADGAVLNFTAAAIFDTLEYGSTLCVCPTQSHACLCLLFASFSLPLPPLNLVL